MMSNNHSLINYFNDFLKRYSNEKIFNKQMFLELIEILKMGVESNQIERVIDLLMSNPNFMNYIFKSPNNFKKLILIFENRKNHIGIMNKLIRAKKLIDKINLCNGNTLSIKITDERNKIINCIEDIEKEFTNRGLKIYTKKIKLSNTMVSFGEKGMSISDKAKELSSYIMKNIDVIFLMIIKNKETEI